MKRVRTWEELEYVGGGGGQLPAFSFFLSFPLFLVTCINNVIHKLPSFVLSVKATSFFSSSHLYRLSYESSGRSVAYTNCSMYF